MQHRVITSPSVVRGKLSQRGIVRGFGALILTVGGVSGAFLWATATDEETICAANNLCVTVEVTNEEQLWAGRALLAGSIVAGVIMLTRSDTVTVELIPGVPTGLSAPARFAVARDRKAPSAPNLSGLSLVGRF